MSFNGKVLLVDDEPHIRKYVSVLLRTLGSPIIFEATNGREAVELFERERPDLTLLDVNMPVQDGLETLPLLLALDPDAVIVMLTSLTTRQIVEEAAQHGATSYLRKDLPRDELAAAIREIITNSFEPDADE